VSLQRIQGLSPFSLSHRTQSTLKSTLFLLLAASYLEHGFIKSGNMQIEKVFQERMRTLCDATIDHKIESESIVSQDDLWLKGKMIELLIFQLHPPLTLVSPYSLP
jgi:hypothetical protein